MLNLRTEEQYRQELATCWQLIEQHKAAELALRKDAERYRWLRDSHPADKRLWVAMGIPHSPAGVSCWRLDELDAKVDAYIAADISAKAPHHG